LVFSKKRGLNRRPGPPVHDDLVERDFTAAAPNELWLTDITEHPTAEGKLYLCAVKDVYSGRIVGYSMDSRMKSSLAVTALQNAVLARRPAGTVVHSDRGSQDGFNRSSQHLDSGGSYGQASRLDEGVDGQVCDEITREAVITAGHRARVLACDRDGVHERGGGDIGRRVASGWNALVPGSWRHADVHAHTAQRPVPFV
jgi:putative transposase